MAVHVSKSGGIYIEISGDYTQLQKDLRAVNDLAKTAGNDISKSLDGAIDPKRAAASLSSLSQSLMKAQAAGKALAADFSSQQKAIREWGQMVGMAGKSLDNYVAVQTKALRNQSAKAFAAELRNIQRLTGESDAAMNAMAKSLGGLGNEFTKASRSTRDLCLNMTALYVEAAKVAALKMAWDGFKSAFDLASRYETLGVVVQQVGKVAGYSTVEIDKSVNAIRRMGIAGVEARQSLTKLIQAQVDISKTPDLARVAQDAAVIGGINSSEAFERMVHGIQSASTLVLRNIGINVNFEQSYAKMAAQIGKTTDELTEQEKVQARVNAVMEAGEKITGSYEAAMGTLGKQIGSLSRLHQDLGTDTGKFFTDLAKSTGSIKVYSEAIQELNGRILLQRGKNAGLLSSELREIAKAQGLEGLREIVEAAEKARERIDAFRVQIASMARQGVDIAPMVASVNEIENNLFSVREEMKRVEESRKRALNEGWDTTYHEERLKSLAAQAWDLAKGLQTVDVKLKDVLATSGTTPITQADSFIFKPAIASPDGQSLLQRPDIREIDKTLNDLRAAYGKTAEGAKEAKLKIIAENKELVAAMVAQGLLAAKEGARLTKSFDAERDKLLKGSRTASIAAERTAYQAAEALEQAAAATKGWELRIAELAAQISGSGLAASLLKITMDYETQLRAIEKKEAELNENRKKWAAEGKLNEESKKKIDDALKELDAQKKLLVIYQEKSKELARQKAIESAVGFNLNTYTHLTEKLEQLKKAYDQNIISLEQYRIKMAETAIAAAEWHQQQGFSSWGEDAMLALAKVAEGYKGVSAGMTEAFGGFFVSFSQGISDSIGAAIWQAESLSDAIYDVATGALQALTSALINLAVQWAVMELIAPALGLDSNTKQDAKEEIAAIAEVSAAKIAAMTAEAGVAMGLAATSAAVMAPIAGGLLAAWTPAAVAASIATMGTASATGLTAFETAMATAQMTSSLSGGLPGFDSGGFTGAGNPHDPAGIVHKREFVFDAPAVDRIGVANLEALRRGDSLGSEAIAASYIASSRSSSSAPVLEISIENYGTSKDFQVEQLSESEVRIIARDEAEAVVQTRTPTLMASEIANPNSKASKALNTHTKIERRR